MRSARVLVLGTSLAMGVLTPALGWEIPLTVKNNAGSGVPPFVSGGVPLVAGQELGDGLFFPPAAHWLLSQPPKSKAGSSSKP